MNPGYPSEAVALQGTRNDGFPGQPAGHQYVVNMPAEPPKDHIIWSIFSLVYGNFCCLGLAAFTFSIKARDRKVVGDVNGAQHYGSTARYLNIVATVLMVLTIASIIIGVIVTTHQANAVYHSYNFDYRG